MPHLDSLLENILTHGATGRGANTPTRRTPYEQGLPLYDPVMTHTLARTMEELRKHGYAVEKVEQAWNMYTRKRKDLFGMLDALALKNGELIGVQACS